VASGSGVYLPSNAITPQVTPDEINTNPIINNPMSTPICNMVTKNCNEPKRSDFQIPEDESEHELFIERLMTVGSTRLEAEQIITSRKTAFNKATRKFKRLSVKQTRSRLKKDSKNSKRVSKEPDQHGAQACHT
jgi:hypothetical protein